VSVKCEYVSPHAFLHLTVIVISHVSKVARDSDPEAEAWLEYPARPHTCLPNSLNLRSTLVAS
jgi:hypothetical protein